MNTLAAFFGTRLKTRRLKLGLSQTALATLAGIAQPQISRYENGEAEPNATAILALAQALQTSTDWLLGASEDETAIQMDDLNPMERQALTLFRVNSPERQRALIEILRLA